LLYAGVSLNHDTPISASPCSYDDRCVPVHPAIGWDGVSQTFLPGWPWTVSLLLSASWVVKITHWSQHQPPPSFWQSLSVV
jgi:hypothetical protein